MSDFDVVAAEMNPSGGKCSLGRILRELPEDKAKELEDALTTHSSRVISAVLKQWGHPLSDQSVNRHKSRRCKCDD